jgi:hypothetical protein
MKIACYSFILLGSILFQACGKHDVGAQKIKTLDSLGGSVNSMVKELERTDTVLLQKYLARFSYYSQFISENVHDTISKEQADNLRQFYEGGKNLEAYAHNRRIIIKRTRLVNSQLLKLSADLRENKDPEVFSKFIFLEKQEASRLTEAGIQQQQKFHSGMEEFKNSLRGVEDLIKSRNRGELPTIIKDTIVL